MREYNHETERQAVTPLDYRTPMNITELYIYWNRDGHYLCPRCRVTLEREFTAYCDRCGQCLNWANYRKAKRIHVPGIGQ